MNWDFWCGPSKVLPFKNHYLGFCLNWGPWLEFGDGHLADMGAHGLNLPWRALKLGAALNCSTKVPEPVKDSYPSATDISWDFAARGDMPAVKLWWHDGGKRPPEELGKELISTYSKVPGNGVLFAGEKGILCSDCWGVGGVVKLKGEAKCRGVQDHHACKPVPVTLAACARPVPQWRMAAACKGGPKTFQGFETAAMVAEIAMVGMLAIRFRPGVNAFSTIEWDSEALKVPGAPRGRRHRAPPHAAEVAVRSHQESCRSSSRRVGRVKRVPPRCMLNLVGGTRFTRPTLRLPTLPYRGHVNDELLLAVHTHQPVHELLVVGGHGAVPAPIASQAR